MTTETKSTVNQRREDAAKRMGVDVSRVQTHKLHLQQMRENGLLIDLDIYGVSMFSVRTTMAELGISSTDVRVERLRGGRKDLFPKFSKKYRSIEARARQLFAAHTFRVAAFGGWAWMPWTTYDDFTAALADLQADISKLNVKVVSQYDELREANAVYFEAVAKRAWKDLRAGYPEDSKVIIVTKSGAFENRAQFVSAVVSSALSKMPTRQDIMNVRIDYRTSVLYSEGELAEDQARVTVARAEAAKAEKDVSWLDLEKAEQRVQLGKLEREAEAQKQAIFQAELEHARAQLSTMGSPLQEALDTLRTNIYDAVQQLLAGVQKNDGFRGRAAAKAKSLYAYWNRLNANLLDDAELENTLKLLAGEVASYEAANKDAKSTQVGEITARLNEVAALTAESARKMRNAGKSRASALEL